MATGEVIFTATTTGGTSGTPSLSRTVSNVFDATYDTDWYSVWGSGDYAGLDLGTAANLTRVRYSASTGWEDAVIGGTIQASNTSFPATVGFLQAAENNSFSTGVTVLTVTLNGQGSGNTNLLFIVTFAATTFVSVKDQSNNNYTQLIAPTTFGGDIITVYDLTNIASGNNTVTVTFGQTQNPYLCMAEYVAGIVDVSRVDGASSANPTGTAVTTLNANDIIVVFTAMGNGLAGATPGAGYTRQFGVGNPATSNFGYIVDKAVTSTGPYTGVVTDASPGAWVMATVALKFTPATSPTTLYTVPSRPVPGLLMNEVLLNPGASYRYYRYLSAPGGHGNLSDIDFIGNWTTGVTGQCCTPTASPASGIFDLPTVVTLSCLTTDAVLYYTLDGTTPTIASTIYNGPFVLSASATLKAIGISPNVANSRVLTTNYIIGNSVMNGNIYYDNRGYRLFATTDSLMLDPVSKKWFLYGVIMDGPGVYDTTNQGYMGVNVYSSADLRNWKYESVVADSAPGLQQNNRVIYSRQVCIYNAANNNYVMWIHQGYNGLATASQDVYTSSSPTGPFTKVASYTSLNSQTCDGDMSLFVDADGVTAYVVVSCSNSSKLLISRLSANYQNVDGVHSLLITNGTFGWTGISTREAPHLFVRNGVYFLMTSGTSNWSSTTNEYATASAALGPYTFKGNPFQTVSGGTPDNTIAYDSQNLTPIQIPGRDDGSGLGFFVYWGDRYGISGLTFFNGFQVSYGNGDFATFRTIILPITFPTSTTMSINWMANWNFDTVAPLVSSAPVPPSNLQVHNNVATWANNDANAVTIYIDHAQDVRFTQGVYSAMVPVGQASFNISLIAPYYRVRMVNANGTSWSAPWQSTGQDANSLLADAESSMRITSGQASFQQRPTFGASKDAIPDPGIVNQDAVILQQISYKYRI